MSTDKMTHISTYNRAIEWARNVLDSDTLILDTETTGLNGTDEVIQLAIVDLRGTVLFESLFKPTQAVSTRAARIHGIETNNLINAPDFNVRYKTIYDILEDHYVIAYNRAFDQRLLDQTCKRYRLPEFDVVSWGCAMQVFSQFYGDWSKYHGSYKWQSLGEAAGYFGVIVQDSHEAAADCLTTLGVIRGMAGSKLKNKDMRTDV